MQCVIDFLASKINSTTVISEDLRSVWRHSKLTNKKSYWFGNSKSLRLKSKNFIIKENGIEILRIKQQKGEKIVHLPAHPLVKSILNQYGDQPPQVITNQKFNEGLKEIGEKAKLGKISIGGKIVDKKDLLSTHTARRSFATNAYLSKSMQVYEIMNCTGQRSESSFLKYLKLDGLDYAKLAAESKFFNDFDLLKLRVA